MSNPYQILRVKPDADQAQIEEAYHRLRKLVAYGSAGNGVTERTVTSAYTTLSDPRRREMIDIALGHGQRTTRARPARPHRASRKGLLRKLLGWLHLT